MESIFINFESVIGVEKEIVVDLLDKISKEKQLILSISGSELNILKNSFEAVFRKIDEWEFQTRIGISIKKANEIKEKLD